MPEAGHDDRALSLPVGTQLTGTDRFIAKGRVFNKIRELRQRAGLTQAELADRVSATRQTIIAVEAGKYAPSLELAFRIARVFGAPFEDVWSFDDAG